MSSFGRLLVVLASGVFLTLTPLIAGSASVGVSAAQRGNVLDVATAVERYNLHGYVERLEGHSDVSAQDVLRLSSEGAFRPLVAPVVTASGRVERQWFKLSLANSSKVVQAVIVELGNTTLTTVKAYEGTQANGKDVLVQTQPVTGIWHPTNRRWSQAEQNLFKVELLPSERKTLYVEIESVYGSLLTFIAWDEVAYRHHTDFKASYRLVGCGFLLAAAFFGMLLATAARDIIFLLGGINALLGAITLMVWNGYLFRFAPIEIAKHAWYLVAILPALGIASYSLFALKYLQLNRYSPWGHYFLLANACAALMAVALIASGRLYVGVNLVNVLGLIAPTAIVVFSVIVMQRGYKSAKWLIAGCLVLMLTAMSVATTNFGLLVVPWRSDLLMLALVVEATMFLIAQFARIRNLHRLAGVDIDRYGKGFKRLQKRPHYFGDHSYSWQSTAVNLIETRAASCLAVLSVDTGVAQFKESHLLAQEQFADWLVSRLLEELDSDELLVRASATSVYMLLGAYSGREMVRGRLEYLAELWEPRLRQMTIPVSISMGIACFPTDSTNLDALIHKAKAAQLWAQKLGGDEYCFADEYQAEI